MAPRAWFRQVIERNDITGDPANDGPVTVYERGIEDYWRAVLDAKARVERKRAELQEAVTLQRSAEAQFAQFINSHELENIRLMSSSDADELHSRRTQGGP